MISALIIFITTVVLMILSLLFFPKIRIQKFEISTYWVIALIGAIFMLIFKNVSFKEIGDSFLANTSVNPLKILVLFFSMTFISIFLDEVGFFTYLANKATNITKNNQISLFTILYVFISVLTVFTSNDVIILTFTPFIIALCKRLNVSPISYLFMEFTAANTLSMALLIGNPTNIYIALSQNITFFDYLKIMMPIALLTALFAYGLLLLIFRRDLKKPIEKENTNCTLENKVLVFVGLAILLLTIILEAISNYINLEMYLISFGFALVLLIFIVIYNIVSKGYKVSYKNLFKRLPYELIFFLTSMFTIVLALSNCGITDKLVNILNTNFNVWTYGLSSFLACNLINNIPMSVLYSYLLPNAGLKASYAVIIGSNLGALLTPIGALAGIMWLSILKKNSVRVNFVVFMKYGVMISIPLISFALLLLQLF